MQFFFKKYKLWSEKVSRCVHDLKVLQVWAEASRVEILWLWNWTWYVSLWNWTWYVSCVFPDRETPQFLVYLSEYKAVKQFGEIFTRIRLSPFLNKAWGEEKWTECLYKRSLLQFWYKPSVATQIKDWLVFAAHCHWEAVWAGLFALRRMGWLAMLL